VGVLCALAACGGQGPTARSEPSSVPPSTTTTTATTTSTTAPAPPNAFGIRVVRYSKALNDDLLYEKVDNKELEYQILSDTDLGSGVYGGDAVFADNKLFAIAPNPGQWVEAIVITSPFSVRDGTFPERLIFEAGRALMTSLDDDRKFSDAYDTEHDAFWDSVEPGEHTMSVGDVADLHVLLNEKSISFTWVRPGAPVPAEAFQVQAAA
jgi:hypothetical protein